MTDGRGKLVRLPLSRKRALELIRQTAVDSSRVVVTLAHAPDQRWRALVTRRQIDLTLLEGEMLDAPKPNDHGHWECKLRRLCAGLDVLVHVAIELPAERPCRLYVLTVESEP